MTLAATDPVATRVPTLPRGSLHPLSRPTPGPPPARVPEAHNRNKCTEALWAKWFQAEEAAQALLKHQRPDSVEDVEGMQRLAAARVWAESQSDQAALGVLSVDRARVVAAVCQAQLVGTHPEVLHALAERMGAGLAAPESTLMAHTAVIDKVENPLPTEQCLLQIRRRLASSGPPVDGPSHEVLVTQGKLLTLQQVLSDSLCLWPLVPGP